FKRPGEQIELDIVGGIVQPDASQDTIMVTVAERYGRTDNLPVAFVKGFGLTKGAIATSASPDDNNVVCAGVAAADMALAINEVAAMGGGQVAVADGEVIARLPLPVGGIVADLVAEDMAAAEQTMDAAARDQLGSRLASPFGQLLFLSITAIPDWAMTDLGLIDCVSFKVVDPVVSSK
ncbi:MAG: adenine deaminase C-terminal domain-containing protein, partial [Acidobacteriota bacterium]|nr:adenine deaminase C-terminal domain-containing protein [Acidobacteriota bacterium]